VYNQADLNILDTVACLNATGMRLEDMKRYIANLSDGAIDTYEQVGLLTTQQEKLAEEERHIKLRREYVSLKIEYWKAVERSDITRVSEIAIQTRELATELKKV